MYINSKSTALPIILAMTSFQAKANDALKPDWLTNPPPYLRAAFVESGENLDWLNFKWWKGGEVNMPEAITEMIDILHFYLSHEIIAHDGEAESATQYIANKFHDVSPDGVFSFDGNFYSYKSLDLLTKVELLGGLATVRRTEWGLFASIMMDMGVSFDALYRLYIGKNALVMLRSKHGYKQGTYLKIWDDGEEDNAHLNRYMESLELDANLFDNIFGLMEGHYLSKVKFV